MNNALIYHRLIDIAKIVHDHPLVYLPLIGAWLITELYFIVNADEAHGHTYVMSTGITLVFTAYILSPFAVSEEGAYFGRLHVLLVSALSAYGFFLILFGIRKKFHPWIAEFFGDPGHALVPAMMGILYIEHNIPLDRITLLIVASPVIALALTKTWRRLKCRLLNRRNKEEQKNHCTLNAGETAAG